MLSWRFTIFLLVLLGTAFGVNPDCSSHQVLLKDKCVDCKSLHFGCNECSRTKTKRYFNLTNVEVTQCDICDFGMYKLTLDDNLGMSTQGDEKYMASICVKRCEDFGHNYVSNPNTMQCEYCGPDCTRCTLQYGCVECASTNNGKAIPDAKSYTDLLNVKGGVQSSNFPYNYFSTTQFGGPSSSFQVCKQCDPRCQDCTGYISEEDAAAASGGDEESFGQCKSCHNYVQSAATQKANGGFCKLKKGNLNYCEQVDPKNSTICEFCEKDYFLNSQGNCQQCQNHLKEYQGCKRCDQNTCLECVDGYALSGGRCTKCDLTQDNKNFYYFVTQRCQNCESAQNTRQCKHCDIGWQSTTTDSKDQLLNPFYSGPIGDTCSFKCGESEYPFVDQQIISNQYNQTKTGGKKCMKCNTACLNCVGNSKDQCTDCKEGFYLKISDPQGQIGTCVKKLLDKNLSFNVYVSNLIDEKIEERRQRAGTYEDPFAQLSDALTRAKDLSAPYLSVVSVTIHMFAGNHYSLENRFDALNIYLPKEASDTFQLNLNITIKPLECGPAVEQAHCGQEPVTIYNKIRERFMLDIYTSLTLQKIVIDSVDSILPFGTPCLSERRSCCKVDGNDITNFDFRKDEQCSAHFSKLKLSDSCHQGDSRTMFRAIDSPYRSPQNFTTNSLTLDSSSIVNVFYPMNSLINITIHGGSISLRNSAFENINICGGIIKNVQGKWLTADLSSVTKEYISTKEMYFLKFFENMQYSLNERYQRLYETGYQQDNITYPSQITISSTRFKNLNFHSSVIKDLPQVSEDGGMRYQGLILNLDNFKGPITILDSSFENNLFKFESCMLDDPLSLSQPNFTNNFDLLHRGSTYDKLQIKSLIDIRSHFFPFSLQNNTFRQNSGLKGIINIEQQFNSSNRNSILILGNTFDQNSALIDSNVINLRKTLKSGEVLPSTYRSANDMKCSGLEVTENTFSANVGCRNTQGVMHVYCMDEQHKTHTYVPEIDTQYFTGVHYDEGLLTQQPEEISPTFTLHNVSGTDYKVNDMILLMRGNTFSNNFAGFQRSIVKIEGFPIFQSINEIYTNNENWYPGAFSQSQFSQEIEAKAGSYGLKELVEYPYKAESMVTVWRPLVVKVKGTVFENNYVVDDVDPTKEKSEFVQSHGMLLRDFAGKILLSEGVAFNKNIGVKGGSFGELVHPSYSQIGFKSRILAFDRYKFSSFVANSIIFRENHGYSYNTTGIPNPYFINFTDADFGPNYELLVEKLEVLNNTFEHSDSMVKFHKVNMTFKDYILSGNIGETSKSILSITMDPYSRLEFKNLTAANNNIDMGPIVDLILDKTIPATKASCFDKNLQISNSKIVNNTSKFDTTFIHIDSMPWLWVTFISTSLHNNYGVITNEFYAGHIRRLDFHKSQWNQYGVKKEFSNRNKAKFILMDQKDYKLDVRDSEFDCKGVFDKNMIFNKKKQGDASVFKMEVGSSDSSIFCPQDKKSEFNFDNIVYANCNQALQGAIFNIANGVQLKISNSKSYALNNSAIQGGFAFLDGKDTKITIQDKIKFERQNAYFGGGFYMQDNAHILLQKVEFWNSEVVEAIIYQDQNTSAEISNVGFHHNLIHDRAIISSHDYSFFNLKDSKFEDNVIIGDSGIIYQDNSRRNIYYKDIGNGTFEKGETLQSVIETVTIQRNNMSYGGNLVKVINSNLYFENVAFVENDIFSKSGGIHMSYSRVEIQNSIFDVRNMSDQFYFDAASEYRAEDHMGGYLLIGPNSTLISKNNQYMNSRSNTGGCVAIQGFAEASFEDDQFSKCSALSGGAIAAHDFGKLTIKSCKFENNIAFSGKGENLFAQRFHGSVTIIDSSFRGFMNSIFLDQGHDLDARNLDFEPIESNLITTGRLDVQKYAGGIYMINMKKISTFDNIRMANLTAEYGGCIFIRLDQNFRPQLYNDHYYNFTNLRLSGCRATQDGGAIQLENVRKLSIVNGSILNSTATQKGGGINFNCDDLQTLDCQLQLIHVTIQYNKALEGGGIFSRDVVPSIDKTVTKIVDNVASLYGNDMASFPTKLVRFIPVSGMVKEDEIPEGKSDKDYFERYFYTDISKQRLESEDDPPKALEAISEDMAEWSVRMDIVGIQSGGMIPIQYLALLDHQNQVVTSNRGSMISITLNDFETEIRGAMQFFSMYGVYNISGMQILTQPGLSNIVMTMTAEQRAIKTKGSEFKIEFDLGIRDCEPGEAQLQEGINFICERCIEGFYLLEKPPPKTAVECKYCPQGKALCKGGNEIGPDINYWRKSDMADVFLPCMRLDVCLGLYLYPEAKNKSEKGYKPTGNCEEGYYGAMCAACMPQYAAISQYTCSKCGDRTANILKMLGIMILAILCVVLLIRSTLAGQKKRQTHSVFVKILMNHMQMILITSSFDMKWPPQVKDFLQSITPLMEFQRAIVSYDCFMDPRDPNLIGDLEFKAGPNEFRITYYKLLIYAAMPIFLGICSITVWYIYLRYQSFKKRDNKKEADREMKRLYDSFISTLVILLFLMHPTITNYMIDMFNCMDFDGDRRLLADPQIICGESLHQKIAVPVAAICILFWGIGIPAMIYILMAKEKERLDTDAAKIKYGFLYNGYKRDNYYWEIIIMYRKILCLFISVFLNEIGIIVQALVLLILLVVFTQLNNVTRPFGTRALNEVEDFSLYTQILTIYCGLFFISSADPQSSTYNKSKDFVITDKTQYILFFTIISSNSFFMVLWFIKFILTLRVMIKQSSERLYIALFLCCRRDKLIKEDSKLAREAKRETIIEKIEEIQFFIKKMRDIYSKEIFYEGHDKFLKLLYHIENERKHVDLTVKRHNLYVQGAIARERKLDPTRIQEVLKNDDLIIDADEGGNKLDMEVIKKIRPSKKRNEDIVPKSVESIKRAAIQIDQRMLGNIKALNMDERPRFLSDFEGERKMTSPGSVNQQTRGEQNSAGSENQDFSSLGKIQNRKRNALKDIKFPSMMSDAFSKNDESTTQLVEPAKNAILDLQKFQMDQQSKERIRQAKMGSGFESDEKEDKNKPKYKRPNVIDVQKDVNKSRNAKSRINYEQKERIFAEDLNNPQHVKTYMFKYFEKLVDDPVVDKEQSDLREDSPSPEKSPDKDNNSQASRLNVVKQFKAMPSNSNYDSHSHLSSPIPTKQSIVSNSSRSKRREAVPPNFDDFDNDDPPTPIPGMQNLNDIKVRQLTPQKRDKLDASIQSHPSSSRRGGLLTNLEQLDQLNGSLQMMSPKSGVVENEEAAEMDSEKKIRENEGYRKRLRPEVNLNYAVKIEKEEINQEEKVKIKVVEFLKPNLSKKKQKKNVQFDSGEEKEITISNDSDKLSLSILDSQDSNKVNLNYNREKQTQGAFVGSYSDRDSSQNMERKKSRKSIKKKKEEYIHTPTETEKKEQSFNSPKLDKESSHQTFNTGPQFYPEKSKDTLHFGKSEATLAPHQLHSFMNPMSGDNQTVQTLAGENMPGNLVVSPKAELIIMSSQGSEEEALAKILPKVRMRNKRKNKVEQQPEPKLFAQIANLQSIDNSESSQDQEHD